jgi:hypothetical protein
MALALLSLSWAGCLTGGIYEHTTRPLDTNFNETPSHLGDTRGESRGDSWKTLVIPLIVVPGDLRFDWGDMSVADAMRRAGIETVHYADIERRSFLGIWTQTWVHVYGE